MKRALWLTWHMARLHTVTFGRPYDAPVGVVARCRCGQHKHIY